MNKYWQPSRNELQIWKLCAVHILISAARHLQVVDLFWAQC